MTNTDTEIKKLYYSISEVCKLTGLNGSIVTGNTFRECFHCIDFRQSAGQIAFLHDISIGGDGTNDVYFDDSGISIAQPAPSDGTTTFRYPSCGKENTLP